MRLSEFIDNFDNGVRVQIVNGKNLLFDGSVSNLNTLLNSEVVVGGVSGEKDYVKIRISDLNATEKTFFSNKEVDIEIKRYILLVHAEDWYHDADEWLGIYVNDDELREAYNRYIDWFQAECEKGYYSEAQKLMIYKYNLEDEVFEVVNPKELND